MTEKLEGRLKRHNSGYNKSTKRYASFKLLNTLQCDDGNEARLRKSIKNRRLEKRFLYSFIDRNSDERIGR
jgi:predicted GIY-YIG superfamily endonuclease